jgi:hypothetical protein
LSTIADCPWRAKPVQVRNPKSEIRRNLSNPKPEAGNPHGSSVSAFGFGSDFWFLVSGFTLPL